MRKKQMKKSEKERAAKKTERLAWLLVIAVLLVIIASVIFVNIFEKTHESSLVAGKVNDTPIYYDEIQMYADENKSIVLDEFSKQYDLKMIGSTFWDTSYGGTKPRQELYDVAIISLIRNKVIQQQAVERGIVAPEDYQQMIEALPSESTTEYGPTAMAAMEYNNSLMTAVIDDLKASLLENELVPTEAEERKAFDSLPDTLKTTDFSVQGYLVTWQQEDILLEPQIDVLLQQGYTFEESIEELSSVVEGIKLEPFSFNSEEVHREDVSEGELSLQLSSLSVGEMLEVENQKKVYYIAEKQGGELLTYEQAPNLGRNKWINDAFEIFIDEKVQQAKVDINDDAMNKLEL